MMPIHEFKGNEFADLMGQQEVPTDSAWRRREAEMIDSSKPTDAKASVALISAVIDAYYLALKKREHGGVAQDRAFSLIEKILDKRYEG